MNTKMSFDSAPSQRRVDETGFMHVDSCHVTKEQVVKYYGREIPGWRELGLDPERLYNVYRPGDEIEKAAATFDGLPLQLQHHIDSADEPQTEFRVGSISRPVWRAPYLDCDLHITNGAAISAVEHGDFKEISAAYLYEPVVQRGEFHGQPYDIVMKNIRGNHVALVREGRAGPDVVVADAKPKKKHVSFETWYRRYLAQDAAQRADFNKWLRYCGLAKDDAWITVHPNENGKGSHVLLDDEGYIKAGMGGKFRGERIDLIPRKRNTSPAVAKNTSNAKHASPQKINDAISKIKKANEQASLLSSGRAKENAGILPFMSQTEKNDLKVPEKELDEYVRAYTKEREAYSTLQKESGSGYAPQDVFEKWRTASIKATSAENALYTKLFDENQEHYRNQVIGKYGDIFAKEFNVGKTQNKYEPDDEKWGTEPGTYTIYRTGAPRDEIGFFANTYNGAEAYTTSEKGLAGNGGTLLTRPFVDTYEVTIIKPFVSKQLGDAYEKLFGKKVRLDPTSGEIKKGLTSADLWAKADQKIAKELRRRGHDAWVMTNPAPPAKREMNIIAPKKSDSLRRISHKVSDKVKAAWARQIDKGVFESLHKEGENGIDG